jgi:hypothetical protein
MAGELFFQWLVHLVSPVQTDVQETVHLLLDGRSRHKNLHALEYVSVMDDDDMPTTTLRPLASFVGPLDNFMIEK